MSTATVQFFSDGLGKWASYKMILPETGEGPFSVLMQLHGRSEDANVWIERSNLVRHVAELPLVVVLPDGGTSGYLNLESSEQLQKAQYEDVMIRDIPMHLRRHFNVTEKPWAIGGTSMGGYGAMRLGLKFPEIFASVYSHSSAFHIHKRLDSEIARTSTEDANVFHLAALLAGRDNIPAIAFDCGVDDRQLDINRRFHEHLQSLDIAHHYAEYPGDHDWDYWDEHVVEALAHHMRALFSGGPGHDWPS